MDLNPYTSPREVAGEKPPRKEPVYTATEILGISVLAIIVIAEMWYATQN